MQAAVKRLQGDGVLAEEGAARLDDGGSALRQRGKVAAEAVLFGQALPGELRILAVGDIQIHLQTGGIAFQQGGEPLKLRVQRLAPRRHRPRHRAALAFIQLVLFADNMAVALNLRLQRRKTAQRRVQLGADAVNPLQRQRSQIGELQLLQARLQRQQLILAVGQKNLRMHQRQLNIAVKPRLTAQTAVVQLLAQLRQLPLQLRQIRRARLRRRRLPR